MIEQAEEQIRMDELRDAIGEPTIEELLLCSPEFGLKSLIYCFDKEVSDGKDRIPKEDRGC
jgi:hypothetical protein